MAQAEPTGIAHAASPGAGPAPSTTCQLAPALAAALFAMAASIEGSWSVLALAAPHAWLAWELRQGPGYGAARRLVGLGILGLVGGLLAAALLESLWVLVAAFSCGGVIAAGTAHSLRMFPAATEAGFSNRVPTVHFAMAADLGVSAVWEAGATMGDWPRLERVLEDIEESINRYESNGWIIKPDLSLEFPPPLEKVTSSPRILGGQPVEQIAFESEFEPFDEVIRGRYLQQRKNRRAHALLWRHRGGAARPALISVHGYAMGNAGFDVPWLRWRGWDMAGLHRRLGIDVVYFVLPFHGPRGPTARSGKGFFDEHPLATTAALAQAIWDLRRLTGWLRAQGAPAVGIQGISLGGYVSALYASLDPSLAVAMPTVPAVDLVASLWAQLPGFKRDRWRRQGFDLDTLERAWRLHSPLSRPARVPDAARLIVAGFADRITPPTHARALWEHWERPELYWCPGSHLIWRGRRALQTRIETHLREHLREPAPALRAPSLSRFRPRPDAPDAYPPAPGPAPPPGRAPGRDAS